MTGLTKEITIERLDLESKVEAVDEFFKELSLKRFEPLKSLEQSPCYPIIGVKPVGDNILYYCDLGCRVKSGNFGGLVASINLSSIEHHCKYDDPERHKAGILARLGAAEPVDEVSRSDDISREKK
jgi:hypothetical protein